MTTIRKSLCIKCHKGKPFSKWALYCDKCRKELSPHQEPVATQNYYQVGRAIECGHCEPDKYGEGLKQAEEMAEKIGVEYKCDCKCHLPTQEPMEWAEKIEDEFIAFWDSKKESLGLGNYSSDITQFWLNKIKQAEERDREKCRKETMEGLHDMLWNKDGSLKSHDISTIVSGVMHYFMK